MPRVVTKFDYDGEEWLFDYDGEVTKVYDYEGDERVALPGEWTERAIVALLRHGDTMYKRGRQVGREVAFADLRRLIGAARVIEDDEKG